jgi:transcriptional regulator GlxA family with amidase domain
MSLLSNDKSGQSWSRMGAHRIAVVTFDGVQAMDIFGPVEVFATADRIAGGAQYAVELVAAELGGVDTSSGVRLVPDGSSKRSASSA